MHNGKVVKIQNSNYDIVDEFGNIETNVILNQPNIIISEEILQACGFVKCEEEAYTYILKINDKSLIGVIKYSNEPLRQICEIVFTLRGTMTNIVSKNIIVLSELQDFIRINIGRELNIDIRELSKIIPQI